MLFAGGLKIEEVAMEILLVITKPSMSYSSTTPFALRVFVRDSNFAMVYHKAITLAVETLTGNDA